MTCGGRAEDSQRLALLQGLDCAFLSEICEYEVRILLVFVLVEMRALTRASRASQALILEDQERLEESANAYANGALVRRP